MGSLLCNSSVATVATAAVTSGLPAAARSFALMVLRSRASAVASAFACALLSMRWFK